MEVYRLIGIGKTVNFLKFGIGKNLSILADYNIALTERYQFDSAMKKMCSTIIIFANPLANVGLSFRESECSKHITVQTETWFIYGNSLLMHCCAMRKMLLIYISPLEVLHLQIFQFAESLLHVSSLNGIFAKGNVLSSKY